MTTPNRQLKEWEEKICNLVPNIDVTPLLHYIEANFILKAELLSWLEGEKKQDLNLEPGFNITAEYRLGEIRGQNMGISSVIEHISSKRE